MDNARTTSNRLRTENQELKTETKELKKELGKMKDLFNSEQLEALRHHFPKHIKSYGRGERPTQANHQKQRFRYGVNSPPPQRERPNGSFTQWSVTPFGFEEILQGSKNGCVLIRKSLWCGRSSGRVVPPLAAGRSSTDDFLSSWLYAVFRV